MLKRALLLLIPGALAASCLSPTLPLPPPDPPTDVTDGGDGTWQVRGDCAPGAVVYLTMEDGRIFGQEDRDVDGRYFITAEGEHCSLACISQIEDTDISGSTCFYLVPTAQSEPSEDCR